MNDLEVFNEINLLDETFFRNISADEFEEMARKSYESRNYTSTAYERKVNEEIINGARVTKFMDIFRKYLFTLSKIPTVGEFWDYYCEEARTLVGKFNDKEYENFKTRVYKQYPSLIREPHCILLLREQFKDARVIFHERLDSGGSDVCIIYNTIFFYVNIAVNTRRSLENIITRKKKFLGPTFNLQKISTHSIEGRIEIFLPFQINFSNKDIQLFSREEVDLLVHEVRTSSWACSKTG
jgi:hypothetical protein